MRAVRLHAALFHPPTPRGKRSDKIISTCVSLHSLSDERGPLVADTGSSIFTQQARERLQSPDDLDRYVRVTSPSVWVILGAVVALLFGLLAWGIFGSVSANVGTMAAKVNGQTICFVDANDIAKVTAGDEALVNGVSTKVASVSKTPYSRDEVNSMVNNDFLSLSLMKGDWAYLVTFEDIDVEEDVPLTASITTERVAPISLVLG